MVVAERHCLEQPPTACGQFDKALITLRLAILVLAMAGYKSSESQRRVLSERSRARSRMSSSQQRWTSGRSYGALVQVFLDTTAQGANGNAAYSYQGSAPITPNMVIARAISALVRCVRMCRGSLCVSGWRSPARK